MFSLQHHSRLWLRGITLLVSFALVGLGVPLSVLAAEEATTIIVRPHCADAFAGDAQPVNDTCPTFTVEDPQTLKTDALTVGDIFDVDIVVENPDRKPITHVRSWLSYDPNLLEGVDITVHPSFPFVTPGESDFDPQSGYAMIEGSNDGPEPTRSPRVTVAHVSFKVQKAVPSGTFLMFYDVQIGGHTVVTTTTAGTDENILTTEPGVLHVVLAEGANTETSEGSTPSEASSESSSTASADDQASSKTSSSEEVSSTPASSSQVSSVPSSESSSPQPFDSTLPDGSACSENDECASNNCDRNVCLPNLEQQRNEAQNQRKDPVRSAFGLLQVQNLRLTSEEDAIYLAWEALGSSALKAYNVYYGTTSGQYIHRKTIDGKQTSLSIKNLPRGTRYFLAVRAVSIQDEESAFSQEVAVDVGNPKSATVPLSRESIAPSNPLSANVNQEKPVPGETGTPSVLIGIVLLSAVIGTLCASRRQMIARHAHVAA